jgi:hypothetical protein
MAFTFKLEASEATAVLKKSAPGIEDSLALDSQLHRRVRSRGRDDAALSTVAAVSRSRGAR